MNKQNKGLLSAASIITIVACSIAILLGLFLFLCAGFSTEKIIKESYMTDSEYTYYEEIDGSYYFTGVEDGEIVTITDEDINSLAKIVKVVFVAMGVGVLGVSIAKLVLAILILVATIKEKSAKGKVIALLVLSLINFNVAEVILLILALIKQENTINKPDGKPLGLDDINIE